MLINQDKKATIDREVFKKDRAIAVSNIEVTHAKGLFQGDETSQDRMSRAINGLPDDVTTIPWRTSDNLSVSLNKLELRDILFQAGMAQSALWS